MINNKLRTCIRIVLINAFLLPVLVAMAANLKPCSVEVVAYQDKGYVSGRVDLYRKHVWEEAGLQKVDWKHVDWRELNKGTTTFHVAPDTYYTSLSIGGTEQRTKELTLSRTERKRFEFEIATLEVAARQDKGYVSGRVYLYRKHVWEEEGLQKVDWKHVDWRSLNKGTTTFHVAPDIYKLIFDSVETKEITLRETDLFRANFNTTSKTWSIDHLKSTRSVELAEEEESPVILSKMTTESSKEEATKIPKTDIVGGIVGADPHEREHAAAVDKRFAYELTWPAHPDSEKFESYGLEIVSKKTLLEDYSFDRAVIYVAVPEDAVVDYVGQFGTNGIIGQIADTLSMKNYPPKDTDYGTLAEGRNILAEEGVNAVLGLVPLSSTIMSGGKMLESLVLSEKGKVPPKDSVFYDLNGHDVVTFTWEKNPLAQAQRILAFRCFIPIRFPEEKGLVTFYVWLWVTDRLNVPKQYTLGPLTVDPWRSN